jgi:thiol:disulfide interchange protein
MNTKRFIGILAGAGLCAWLGWEGGGCASENLPAAVPDHLAWLTDVPQAQAQAKTENKLVMLDFTGSDWCPTCRLFNNQILATPEFANYAAGNLVLVKLDYPRKTPQPAALAKANAELFERFEVKAYPTILLLDGNGRKLGAVKFEEGGPAPFIAQLEKLKKG